MRACIIIDVLVILFCIMCGKKKQASSATRKPAVHGACIYVCNNYYGNSVKRMIFLREFKYNK